MPLLTSELVLKLVDSVSGPAKKVETALNQATRSVRQIETALGGTGLSSRFQQQLSQLGLSAGSVDRVAVAFRHYASAAQLAGNATNWTRAQQTQVKAWETATLSSLRAVTAAERSYAAQSRALGATGAGGRGVAGRGGLSTLGAGGFVAPFLGGASMGGTFLAGMGVKKAVSSAAEFDIAVRKQRAFTGISDDDQKSLIGQAKRIGRETIYTNEDIVKAQTAIMQSLPAGAPKVQIGEALTENIQHYAQTVGADMEESSRALISFLQSTGKDISTYESAYKEAKRGTNLMVRMAKLSGMTDEDVRGFLKFGSATGHVAGFSDETMMALGVGLKRAGFQGQEAGVATRALAGKLVSPTTKGREALAAMGIDYSKYAQGTEGMTPESLEKFMALRFGQNLSGQMKERVGSVLEDESVVGDAQAFQTEMFKSLEPLFVGKGGKLKAQDSEKLSKAIADYYKLSVESVDVEGLLRAIFSDSRSLAQLNALFTEKHGGKFGALDKGAFGRDVDTLKATGGDFAKEMSDAVMAGLGGELNRLKGSIETAFTTLGTSAEGVLIPAMRKAGEALDLFTTSLDNVGESKQKLEAMFPNITAALTKMSESLSTSGTAFGLVGTAATSASGALMKFWQLIDSGLGRINRLLGTSSPAESAAPAWQQNRSLAPWPDKERLNFGSSPGSFGWMPPGRVAPAPYMGGGGVGPTGTPGAGGLGAITGEMSGAAGQMGGAGREGGGAFRAGLGEELQGAASDTESVVQRIIEMLSFTANPSINGSGGGGGGGSGRQASLPRSDAFRAAHGDVGFGLV